MHICRACDMRFAWFVAYLRSVIFQCTLAVVSQICCCLFIKTCWLLDLSNYQCAHTLSITLKMPSCLKSSWYKCFNCAFSEVIRRRNGATSKFWDASHSCLRFSMVTDLVVDTCHPESHTCFCWSSRSHKLSNTRSVYIRRWHAPLWCVIAFASRIRVIIFGQ